MYVNVDDIACLEEVKLTVFEIWLKPTFIVSHGNCISNIARAVDRNTVFFIYLP